MHCQKKSNEIGNAKESLIVMKYQFFTIFFIVQNLVKTVENWFLSFFNPEAKYCVI